MKKASEYREHAEDCRALARGMKSGDQQDQLHKMAENWEQMARERSDLVRQRPDFVPELNAENDG